MPIQVDTPKQAKTAPLAVLAVLVVAGIVFALNWRAVVLALVVIAALAGWWLAQ